MKRLILGVIIVALVAGNAFAAWTIIPTVEIHGPKAIRVKLVCIADGSASGAQELRSILSASDWAVINGGNLKSVSVVPGTGSVAPDAAYDVNVYDSAGTQTIDATTTSASSVHTYPTSDGAVMAIQQILNGVPFDVGDIGSSGDMVTLYFNIQIP